VSKLGRGKNNKKSSPVLDAFLTIGVPILVLIIWEYVCDKGIVPKAALTSPSGIVKKAVNLLQKGSLQKDILISLQRIVKGFVIGTLAGIILGVAIGLFDKFEKATSVILAALRPIPMLALLPLFILWFGIGEKSKVAVIILCTFFSVLLNTISGMKSADKKLIEMASVLGASKLTIIFKIILPASFPYIYTGIRLGVGNAIMGVVTSEMICASEGVGYMILYARVMAQTDTILVGVCLLGLFGLVIDYTMVKLQPHIFKY
jgi:sulfonate transport system permease protein